MQASFREGADCIACRQTKICVPFIYCHGNDQSRICFFLSYSLYRLPGYFDFLSMPDTLIKLWCWLGVKSNHRINHLMNLFYSFWEKLSVLPRGPVVPRESLFLCSIIPIGRNSCDLFLCPTFLWLWLKVSISWTCSNSPSFSQILSQQYVWTLRCTKRYLVLSSPLCPITIQPPTVFFTFFSWLNSFSPKGHMILT